MQSKLHPHRTAWVASRIDLHLLDRPHRLGITDDALPGLPVRSKSRIVIAPLTELRRHTGPAGCRGTVRCEDELVGGGAASAPSRGCVRGVACARNL